jgi:hypothetical protein
MGWSSCYYSIKIQNKEQEKKHEVTVEKIFAKCNRQTLFWIKHPLGTHDENLDVENFTAPLIFAFF